MRIQGTASCVMVVGGRQGAQALLAADDFALQTFPEKELILVTEDRVLAGLVAESVPRTRHVDACTADPVSARNAGLAAAGGTFCCVWDADSRHHPNRLASQFWGLESEGTVVASGLADRLTLVGEDLYWTEAGTRRASGCDGIFPDTLFFRRRPARFDASGDVGFFHSLTRWGNIAPIKGRGYLCVRVVHRQVDRPGERATLAKHSRGRVDIERGKDGLRQELQLLQGLPPKMTLRGATPGWGETLDLE